MGFYCIKGVISSSHGPCIFLQDEATSTEGNKKEKSFECSFLLFHFVSWSGILVRANTIGSVRMW